MIKGRGELIIDFIYHMGNFEVLKEKESQEINKKGEIIDQLLSLGRDQEKDKEFLREARGSDILEAINYDLSRKSKQFNDPQSKAKVEELVESMRSYSIPRKLSEEQIEEISSIYKKIVSIEGTEHAEDAKSQEEAKKSAEEKKQLENKRLIEACDELQKLLKSYHEKAQEKLRSDSEKIKLARKQEESFASHENLEFPLPQKESAS